MSTSFERIDHGKAKLIRKLSELSKRSAFVGFPAGGPVHPDAGDNVASLALIHEFGSPSRSIPERPFQRNTISRTRLALQKVRAALYEQWIAGNLTDEQYLMQMGEWYVGQLKRTITEGSFVELAPATIARKKSTRPLFDTGFLRNSITYRLGNSK